MVFVGTRTSKIALGALVGVCLCALWYGSAVAQTVHVHMVTGTVLAPPDLAEGQRLAVGQQIRLGSDGLVILRYSWPSDDPMLSCNRYVIVSGLPDYRVRQESGPANCSGGADLNQTLNRLNRGERFKAQVTFYGDAPVDAVFARHISRSQQQAHTFEAGIRRIQRQTRDGVDEGTLKRFLLRFSDAYLIHRPGAGWSPQIYAQGTLLSYRDNWEVKQMKPYLYHLRQKGWKGFFWKVNTSRKQVYRVRGGTFGQYGGEDQVLDIEVDPMGRPENPERFLLRFSDAHLVHRPGAGSAQIVAQGTLLSYRGDWKVKQMKPYLYHLRQKDWKGFFWKVNTSRKQVYRVRGGTFGQYGGESQILNVQVDPVY